MGRKKDILFGAEDYFTPNKINSELARQIFAGLPQSVKDYGIALVKAGWRFYAVDQTRGYCYYKEKVITIPAWVILSSRQGEKCWYVSHEMAHAYDETRSNHGPEFMAKLIEICPDDCIHYELEYKPRNASNAGITINGVSSITAENPLGF